MARIDDTYLKCVVYIYPSEEEACSSRDKRMGASGFIVTRPCPVHKGHVFAYLVTNRHVIIEFEKNLAEAVFVRINLSNGESDLVSVSLDSWVHYKDDISACRLKLGYPSEYQIIGIGEKNFLCEKEVENLEIGIGDEAFLIGRHSGHEGRLINTPVARFGCISMMPLDPVSHPDPNIAYQESFLVEIKSLSGFSGSPVFVHIPKGSIRPFDGGLGEMVDRLPPKLLGINWGHLSENYSILEGGIPSGKSVSINTGMAVVVPAWKLKKLIHHETFNTEIAQHSLVSNLLTNK